MTDFRLYRAAFLLPVAALVVLLFSLEGAPGSLEPSASSAGFDGRAAAAAAREIVASAPERAPGSEGSGAAADVVAERFGQIKAGEVTEMGFEAEFDGDDRDMRDVVLTLPGESDRAIAVLAARDSASGTGAASSAAATGALLELASHLAVIRHTSTLVFVSTDGGSEGASGARAFAQEYPGREAVEATVVVTAPGIERAGPPTLLLTSASTTSANAALAATGRTALAENVGIRPDEDGTLEQLFGLAVPSGLGEQAALIEEGEDAIALSAVGERDAISSEGAPDEISADTLGELGRAAADVVLALDAADEAPAGGPESHVPLSGSLVPGWALALLALALAVPPLVAAVDALARAARDGAAVGGAVVWAASRAVPFLGALAALYLLTLLGIQPSPPFPFDPGRFEPGVRAGVVAVVLLAVLVAAARSAAWARGPGEAAVEAAPAAAGVVSGLGLLVVWLANPYLALLLVGLAHVWLVGDRAVARPALWQVGLAGIVALVPAIAALGSVGDRLEVGGAMPWQLALMIADGQIPFLVAVGACFLAGCLVASLVLSLVPVDGSPIRPRRREDDVRPGAVDAA